MEQIHPLTSSVPTCLKVGRVHNSGYIELLRARQMDSSCLRGMDGIEGAGVLRRLEPSLAVIMLSVFRDEDRIFRAICAGACGYLLKTTAPDRILSAVREVHGGGAAMSPEIAIRVLRLLRKDLTPDPELTPRERSLLKLMADGHQNKTAAAELGITIHTIGFHLRAIYGKLHVHSRAEAVARALRSGLI